MISSIDAIFCDHPTIQVRELANSKIAYISCKRCQGYLTEYRTDIPESKNFDLMLARKLYVFGDVYKLKPEQLKKWV